MGSHPLLPLPTPEWGRGEPGEGKAAEMSHQERESETEMRRDIKRDSYWRDRERKTHSP